MAGLPIVENSLAWAQLQLRGGWARVVARGFWYGMGLIALVFITCRLDPNASRQILGLWCRALLVLQAVALLFWVPSGLVAKVRLDIGTKMLESHRLSPIRGTEGVSGYLLGAAADIAPIVLINVVLGLLTATFSLQSIEAHVVTHSLLIWLAILFWPAAVYIGLATKFSLNWVFMLVAAAVIGGGLMLGAFPALVLLISPLLTGMIRGGTSRWLAVYPVTLIAQAVLGGVFFIAASRRFRSDERPAFGPILGTVVLTLWVGLSIIGIRWQHRIVPQGYEVDTTWQQQVTASMSVGIGLSLVPIASVAWADKLRRRRKRFGDRDLPRRGVPLELIVAISAVLCLCVLHLPLMRRAALTTTGLPRPSMLGIFHLVPWEDVARLGVVVVLALLSMSWIVRLCYRHRKPAAAWLVVWAIGVCLMLPMAVELTRYQAGAKEFMPPAVLALSPIGAMQLIIEQDPQSIAHGLFAQGVIAAVIGLIFLLNRNRDLRPEGPEPAPPKPSGPTTS